MRAVKSTLSGGRLPDITLNNSFGQSKRVDDKRTTSELIPYPWCQQRFQLFRRILLDACLMLLNGDDSAFVAYVTANRHNATTCHFGRFTNTPFLGRART